MAYRADTEQYRKAFREELELIIAEGGEEAVNTAELHDRWKSKISRQTVRRWVAEVIGARPHGRPPSAKLPDNPIPRKDRFAAAALGRGLSGVEREHMDAPRRAVAADEPEEIPAGAITVIGPARRGNGTEQEHGSPGGEAEPPAPDDGAEGAGPFGADRRRLRTMIDQTIRDTDKVRALCFSPDGRVRNAKLLMAAVDGQRKNVEAIAKVNAQLLSMERLEKFFEAIVHTIEGADSALAERVLRELDATAMSFG